MRFREEAHPARDVPDSFIFITTGMGEAPPRSVVVLPVLFEGETKAVIELASFSSFSANHLTFLDQLMDSIGVILNMISSSMRTEELLQQLKTSNAELEAQAGELNDKAKLLEVKNQRGRAREPEPRGKGRAAPAHLQVQVRVPGQHVARAADAAQQPAHPVQDAGREPRREPDAEQVKFAKTVYHVGQRLALL